MYLLDFGGTVKWDLTPEWEILRAREVGYSDGGSKGEVIELRYLHSPFVGGQRYMSVPPVPGVGHARVLAAWYWGLRKRNVGECYGFYQYGMDNWRTRAEGETAECLTPDTGVALGEHPMRKSWKQARPREHEANLTMWLVKNFLLTSPRFNPSQAWSQKQQAGTMGKEKKPSTSLPPEVGGPP